jgi:hypothetical protein
MALNITPDDFVKLQAAWGPALWPTLLQAGREHKDMALRLLAGSLTDYRRATDGWWNTISKAVRPARWTPTSLTPGPSICVSSNTHSFVNLLSGYAQAQEAELAAFLEAVNPENLWHHYQRIKSALRARTA